MKEELGKIIKKAREDSGYTQSDFANKLDINKSNLSKLENGKIKNPNCVILYRIACFLDLDYEDLLHYLGFDILSLDKENIRVFA